MSAPKSRLKPDFALPRENRRHTRSASKRVRSAFEAKDIADEFAKYKNKRGFGESVQRGEGTLALSRWSRSEQWMLR